MSNGVEAIRSSDGFKLLNVGNLTLMQFLANVRTTFFMEMARLILENGIIHYHVSLLLTFREYTPIRTPFGGFMWGARERTIAFGAPRMVSGAVTGMEQYFDECIMHCILYNIERYLSDVPNRDLISADEFRFVMFDANNDANVNIKKNSFDKNNSNNGSSSNGNGPQKQQQQQQP